MSSFKDAVQEDLNSVFLNLDEFAETHTVYYDGEEYSDPSFTTLYQMRSASFRLVRPFFFISRNRAGLILWHQWSARLPICRAS